MNTTLPTLASGTQVPPTTCEEKTCTTCLHPDATMDDCSCIRCNKLNNILLLHTEGQKYGIPSTDTICIDINFLKHLLAGHCRIDSWANREKWTKCTECNDDLFAPVIGRIQTCDCFSYASQKDDIASSKYKQRVAYLRYKQALHKRQVASKRVRRESLVVQADSTPGEISSTEIDNSYFSAFPNTRHTFDNT